MRAAITPLSMLHGQMEEREAGTAVDSSASCRRAGSGSAHLNACPRILCDISLRELKHVIRSHQAHPESRILFHEWTLRRCKLVQVETLRHAARARLCCGDACATGTASATCSPPSFSYRLPLCGGKQSHPRRSWCPEKRTCELEGNPCPPLCSDYPSSGCTALN
jgi:hypothetical protein